MKHAPVQGNLRFIDISGSGFAKLLVPDKDKQQLIKPSKTAVGIFFRGKPTMIQSMLIMLDDIHAKFKIQMVTFKD